MFKRMII